MNKLIEDQLIKLTASKAITWEKDKNFNGLFYATYRGRELQLILYNDNKYVVYVDKYYWDVSVKLISTIGTVLLLNEEVSDIITDDQFLDFLKGEL